MYVRGGGMVPCSNFLNLKLDLTIKNAEICGELIIKLLSIHGT